MTYTVVSYEALFYISTFLLGLLFTLMPPENNAAIADANDTENKVKKHDVWNDMKQGKN
jgi:hypothetical protein